MTVPHDKLMAYADGELAPAERAEIEKAVAADPALRAEVERHQKLRRILTHTYGPLSQEPVPDHLVELIRKSEQPRSGGEKGVVLRFPRIGRTHWLAMAASLVVGVLVGANLMTGADAPSSALIVADAGGLRADGALAAALTQRVSADPATDGVAVGLSFRDEGGDYCRAFAIEADTLSGFACREEDAWRVRMTVAEAPASPGGEFRPAATALPEAVLRAIEDRIAGDPLDAAEETAARARGWSE